MAKKIFADVHCHPSGKVFQKYSNKKEKILGRKNVHPWNLSKVASKKVKLAQGERATKYSQADFARLTKGNVKLVFASMYPFEQGFFDKVDENLIDKMLGENEVHHYGLDDDEVDYSNFTKIGRVPSLLASMITGLGLKRVRYVRSNEYDYWNEFKKEYKFIQKRSGIRSSATIYVDENNDGKVNEKKQCVEGTYWLLSSKKTGNGSANYKPVNGNQIPSLIEKDDDNTYVVLTIEGMNVLSMYNQATTVPEKVLFSRINELKHFDPPIFFVTFAHHFDNNLCCHAHSMPKLNILGPLNPDQSKFMNQVSQQSTEGFTELGLEAARRLLHVTKKADGSLARSEGTGRRILIDVKHMSASSRRDFYDDIISPYNQAYPEDKIPVIASHIGYSGVQDLNTMIANYKDELADPDPSAALNFWNINMSDEDCKIIVESEGLIGICFDQRVLGIQGDLLAKSPEYRSDELIYRNIIGMARGLKAFAGNLAVYDETSYNLWDALCLGTDFDGMVDPPDDYPTATEFPEFIDDMHKYMSTKLGELAEFGITAANLSKVLDKLAYKNALNLVSKHF